MVARWRAGGLAVAVGGVGLAAVVTLAVRDPHHIGSYGFCPVYLATGFYCPACGGLRAVHDLTQLRVLDALGSNALGVALVILGGAGWLAWLVATFGGPRLAVERILTPRWLSLGLVVAVAFTIVRNTAWGAWLAP